jgi:hypothetical protein
MENLKIYSSAGAVVANRDLTGEKGPLMVLAGAVPRLVDTVAQGEEVLGALVRDEDGWTLASAKTSVEVVSGSGRSHDCRLVPGVACSLGGWAFRIESAVVSNGPVLVWRAGSAPATAGRLVQGRNQVSAGEDGLFALNSAIGGDTVCEIFPTADGGADVVTPGGAQRLSVARNTLFSVGPFHGMVMEAADAAAAMKTSNPFSWPARGTRARLMAGLMVAGLVCLAAVSVSKTKAKVEAAVAAKTGAVASERHHENVETQFTDEDVLVYEHAFLRSLPMILKAELSPVTLDLISRGSQLSGRVDGANAAEYEQTILRIVKFLKDVSAVQDAVRKGDWDGLRSTLAQSDRESFVRFDANAFYADAEEIADFVTVKLPGFLQMVSSEPLGDNGLAEAERRIDAYFEDLADNVFMSGEIVRRERDAANERWRALHVYMPARDAFFAGDASASVAALVDAWARLLDVFDPDDPSFAPLVGRERAKLADAVLKRAASADDVSLISLCTLGEAIGMDDGQLAEWRGRAAAARKAIGARYREMYSDYRMRAAVAPSAPETLAVLDRMVALGLEDNPFHQWALREKVRIAAPQTERKEEGK